MGGKTEPQFSGFFICGVWGQMIALQAGYDRIVEIGKFTVGTTAVSVADQLNGVSHAKGQAILLLPDNDNTGVQYWGNADVTVLLGVPIEPYPFGTLLPVKPGSGLHVISDTAGQEIKFVVFGGI